MTDTATTTKYIAIGHQNWGTGLTFGEAHRNWREAGGRTRSQPPKMAVFSEPVTNVTVDNWGNIQWEGSAELSSIATTPESWTPVEINDHTRNFHEMLREWGLAPRRGGWYIHSELTAHDIIVLVGEFLEDW